MKTGRLILTLAVLGGLAGAACLASEEPDQTSGQGIGGIHPEKVPTGDHGPDGKAHAKAGEADKTDARSSNSGGAAEKGGEESPVTREIPSVLSDRVRIKARPASHSPFPGPNKWPNNSGVFHATGLMVSQPGSKKVFTQESVNQFGEEREPLVPAAPPGKAVDLSPHFVPSRVASPVFLGGLTAAGTKPSAAAINGTGMKIKFY
jgi:hypothetical protein